MNVTISRTSLCHSQQAGEKAVKAIWYARDLDPWGHSIARLIRELETDDPQRTFAPFASLWFVFYSMNIEQIARKIVNSAIKVHKALGPGLLESVYQKCLTYELDKAGLNVKFC